MSDVVLNFFDILAPRRHESGIFSFMTRSWKPQETMILDKKHSPQDLKDIASKSVYLDSIIEAECARSGVSKEKLHKEVIAYLEEMGLDKKMHVIRWMGIIFLKITFMMKIQMFVNEPQILKIKSAMGCNPVLFLPTHRSYADFCLMTYLCYHYDIELPAVAAGMDFYSMAVLGRRMRETGAFYIRRTLAGASLYAATLKQYVRTLVSKYGAPVEFFLEGTRSRSNKSLPPKYGMLSMALMPFFAREVSDITIVPVNICYDRLMEHGLFAYEHIGVPKPKESTGGFLKALKSLNDDFGNIYINLGEPISLRQHLDDEMSAPRSDETLKPTDLQQLTPHQFKQVQGIADHVVNLQQKNTIVTVSNVMAMVLMQSYIINFPMSSEEVMHEVQWISSFLMTRGAAVFTGDWQENVSKALLIHRKMMRLDKNNKLRLVAEPLMQVSEEIKARMKGHVFDAETMSYALPVIQLQLYVNPVLHYLIPLAFIYLIAAKEPVDEDDLATEYQVLRKLLRYEFFYTEKSERITYHDSREYCLKTKVIVMEEDAYTTQGGSEKLQFLLRWAAWPALTTLQACILLMIEKRSCLHKEGVKLVQQRLLSEGCHPYSVSLDAIANCMHGLAAYGALHKHKDQEVTYTAVEDILYDCRSVVRRVMPGFKVFGKHNSVMMDAKTLSRL